MRSRGRRGLRSRNRRGLRSRSRRRLRSRSRRRLRSRSRRRLRSGNRRGERERLGSGCRNRIRRCRCGRIGDGDCGLLFNSDQMAGNRQLRTTSFWPVLVNRYSCVNGSGSGRWNDSYPRLTRRGAPRASDSGVDRERLVGARGLHENRRGIELEVAVRRLLHDTHTAIIDRQRATAGLCNGIFHDGENDGRLALTRGRADLQP